MIVVIFISIFIFIFIFIVIVIVIVIVVVVVLALSGTGLACQWGSSASGIWLREVLYNDHAQHTMQTCDAIEIIEM